MPSNSGPLRRASQLAYSELYGMRKFGGSVPYDALIDLEVQLRQGASTTIATWTHPNISPSPTAFAATQTLSGAEADAITNYGDLRLRFTATKVNWRNAGALQLKEPWERARVTWAEVEVPPGVAGSPQTMAMPGIAGGGQLGAPQLLLSLVPPGLRGAGSVGVPLVRFPFTIFSDDFADGTMDSRWLLSTGGTGGSVAETGGQLVATPNTDGGGNINGYRTADTYSLLSGSVSVQLVNAGPQGANVNNYALFALLPDLNFVDDVQWYVNADIIGARAVVAGVATDLFTATYSPTTHAWLRIRETGGTIFWDTSTDGIGWTNRASRAVWQDLHAGSLMSTIGALAVGGSSAGSPNVVFDNYDLVSQTLDLAGLAGGGAVGSPTLALAVAPPGLPGGGALGTPTLALALAPPGLQGGGAVGTPTFLLALLPPGLLGGGAEGPVVVGAQLVLPGLTGGGAEGIPTITPSPVTLALMSLFGGGAEGIPTITPAPVTLALPGLPGLGGEGPLALTIGGVVLNLPSPPRGGAEGPIVVTPSAVTLLLAGLQGGGRLGLPTISIPVTLALQGLPGRGGEGPLALTLGGVVLALSGLQGGGRLGPVIVTPGTLTMPVPGIAGGGAMGMPAITPAGVSITLPSLPHGGGEGVPSLGHLLGIPGLVGGGRLGAVLVVPAAVGLLIPTLGAALPEGAPVHITQQLLFDIGSGQATVALNGRGAATVMITGQGAVTVSRTASGLTVVRTRR